MPATTLTPPPTPSVRHGRVRRVVHLVLFVALSATGVASRAEEEPYTVGVLYWSMNIPGQVAMRAGLEAEAKGINSAAGPAGRRGVTLVARVAGEGEEGIENQIHQMGELVGQGVDLIIVQPTDNAALVPALKAANQASIPVVAYDQYISGGELHSYLTSDNYQAGYLDGEYIAHHFDDRRTVRLILVEYPHVSSTVERVDGVLDALHDQGQPFEILKTYIAVEPESGEAAGESILTDFPEKGSIDALFAVNDGGGLAVAKCLVTAGRTEIFMATIDGDPESVETLTRGEGPIRIDSAQFCGPLGAESMKIAYRVLQGETVPRHLLIPVFPITKETATMYKGWMGPIPARFEKPWPSKYPVWTPEPRTKQVAPPDAAP